MEVKLEVKMDDSFLADNSIVLHGVLNFLREAHNFLLAKPA
jgi:hypothetical protein